MDLCFVTAAQLKITLIEVTYYKQFDEDVSLQNGL